MGKENECGIIEIVSKEVTQVDVGEGYSQGSGDTPNHDRVTIVYAIPISPIY
ncbi:hypothetical protein ISR94_01075 [Candidatus Microgenomates bacterium]|nr:hypothetical protein [Candidatus Microgenomates bacterium]